MKILAKDHWAYRDIAAVRLQCAWRSFVGKQRLSRRGLMLSVDGMRILYDLLENVVSVSIVAAQSRLWRIQKATYIQGCIRGHNGRKLARIRV